MPAPSAAIASHLPLHVVGGGERFTLDTHRSALSAGDGVDLWCAAAVHPSSEAHARRMSRPWLRLERAGDALETREKVSLRDFLRRQRDYDTVVVHQYLADVSTVDILAAAPPRQRVVLSSLGAESIAKVFPRVYEPHRGVDVVEISAYAAARSAERGVAARSLSAGVWRADLRPLLRRTPSRLLRVIAIGRLLPHKAFEIAVDAVAGLGDGAALSIVGPPSGDPAYERHLRSRARRAGNVRLTGVVPDARRDLLLAESDVLVANSSHLTWSGKRLDQPELLGLVILEAVACGVLPIVSDIPSFREVATTLGLEEWIYPERDVAALRATLGRAAALPADDRHEILRTARGAVERSYLWDDYWTRLTGRGRAVAARPAARAA